MELTVKERLFIPMILPQEGSYMENKAKASLVEKTELSIEEAKTINYNRNEDGSVTWDSSKEALKAVELSLAEKELLEEIYRKLDSEKKIRFDMMSLFTKIKSEIV